MHEELEEKLTAIECISSANEELKLSLLSFLLTFNVFENEFFKEPRWNEKNEKKDKNIPAVFKRWKHIQSFMNQKESYLSEQVDEFRQFFKIRYMEIDTYSKCYKWNDIGKRLRSTKKNPDGYDDELFERLRKFLTADASVTKEEAIETCLSLSYVFRNNLFHGGKDIKELENFRECFDVISCFLTNLMRELNKIGFGKAWFPENTDK